MKIRVSELFEDPLPVTDAIELQNDTGIDSEKIKRLVLNKIGESATNDMPNRPQVKGKRARRSVIITVAVLAAVTSALAANAATDGKLFGAIVLNKHNRHIAEKPASASMEQLAPGEQPRTGWTRRATSTIVNESQMREDPLIGGSSITNVAVTRKGSVYQIPEVLTNNGDIVIFTKKNDAGWHLEAGEQLTLHYELDLKTNPGSDPDGERMEVGYIRDGELVSGYFDKASEFNYTVTAEKSGLYYFYMSNWSAGHIITTSGTIE